MIDFEKRLDPSLFELILQQPKNVSSTMLADHNRKLSGLDKTSDQSSSSSSSPSASSAKNNLLPPDANYDLTSVCKLNLMPNVRMMFAGNAAHRILLSDPSQSNAPGRQDTRLFSSEAQSQQTQSLSSSVGALNASFGSHLNSSGVWDMGMVPDIANATFLNASMGAAGEAFGFGDGTDLRPQGGNDGGGDEDDDVYGFSHPEILHSEPIDDIPLVAAPAQVSRLAINYARRAKRVDVKKLKANIWRDLCLGAGETERVEPESKMKEEKTFQDVLSQLPTVSSDRELEDVSVPYCFICLLHLANEKGLSIEATESGDLTIRQDS